MLVMGRTQMPPARLSGRSSCLHFRVYMHTSMYRWRIGLVSCGSPTRSPLSSHLSFRMVRIKAIP